MYQADPAMSSSYNAVTRTLIESSTVVGSGGTPPSRRRLAKLNEIAIWELIAGCPASCLARRAATCETRFHVSFRSRVFSGVLFRILQLHWQIVEMSQRGLDIFTSRSSLHRADYRKYTYIYIYIYIYRKSDRFVF